MISGTRVLRISESLARKALATSHLFSVPAWRYCETHSVSRYRNHELPTVMNPPRAAWGMAAVAVPSAHPVQSVQSLGSSSPASPANNPDGDRFPTASLSLARGPDDRSRAADCGHHGPWWPWADDRQGIRRRFLSSSWSR